MRKKASRITCAMSTTLLMLCTPTSLHAKTLMTPAQAQAKLSAAFECRDKREDASNISEWVKAAGGKRIKHQIEPVGDYASTFTLNTPITLFGQPVTKLQIWQNAGDGGDSSFGLNAYYSVSTTTLAVTARTPQQKVNGKKLYLRRISNQTNLVVDTKDGQTMSFCETTITADDYTE